MLFLVSCNIRADYILLDWDYLIFYFLIVFILQSRCKQVADEYIECEIMIPLIDLILHKPKAYRHLLHNVLNRGSMNLEGFMWKSILGFLVLDTYRMLILVRSVEEWSSSISFSSLVWRLGKVC
ncbi:hypothetical protein QQ045_013200 [Rhodiola kirilowii]